MKIFRFAPSPNGFLHLGHAYSALLNFDLARATGRRLLLRIENIDPARSKPEYERAIVEDLSWLGISFDGTARRQSEHFDDYRAALERLDRLGLLYPCDCTRGDVARLAGGDAQTMRDPDGAPLYPGTCRWKPGGELAALAGRGVALRLRMERALALIGRPLCWQEYGEGEVAAHPDSWGDVILARKDAPTSYHLSVVVDDALQGVTDVVRGRDLYAATGIHRLLQTLLDLSAPRYRHHALLLDAGEKKLAKSRESTSLRALRDGGATPQDIRAMVGLIP